MRNQVSSLCPTRFTVTPLSLCVCVLQVKLRKSMAVLSSAGSRVQRTNALLPRVGLFAIPGIAAGRRPRGFDESRPLHLRHSHSRRHQRYRPRRRAGSRSGWSLFSYLHFSYPVFFYFLFPGALISPVRVSCVFSKEMRSGVKRNLI